MEDTQLKPVDFAEKNGTFTSPGCLPLPACICIENDLPTVITCWELTDEQLETLKDTRRVWLAVIGGQPPVYLTTLCPIPTQETWDDEIET